MRGAFFFASGKKLNDELLGFVVLRPTKLMKRGHNASEWKTDYVEITTFDARNETSREALDGISAGFIVGLLGGQIARNLLRRKTGEGDESRIDELTAVHFR